MSPISYIYIGYHLSQEEFFQICSKYKVSIGVVNNQNDMKKIIECQVKKVKNNVKYVYNYSNILHYNDNKVSFYYLITNGIIDVFITNYFVHINNEDILYTGHIHQLTCQNINDRITEINDITKSLILHQEPVVGIFNSFN